VVGGGVAGCAAALMLARDGHDVELFEQTPHIGPVGAGILLQPSGQAVLGDLGLLDAFVTVAEPIGELVAYTHRGRLLSRLVYADHTVGLQALGVHRADLFGLLHRAVADATGLTRGGRWIGVAGRRVGSFDLILAADGSRSRLRRESRLPAFVHEYAPGALWAVGRAEQPRGRLLQYTRGNRELCGFLPMGGGRCSFFWGIDRLAWPRLRQRPFPAWRDHVRRLAPEASDIFATVTDWPSLMFTTYRAVVMPRVCAERIVFLGDAAHAAGPHLGQGANLALIDAAALRDCLRAASSLDAALQAYNAGQRWRNAWYSAMTAALMPSFQGSLPGIGWARDVILPRLQRVPPIRRLMLQTLCGRW
jgi:2-polyprenyl-6-methoxyphenol hydroxylase-like FAD-dependent oxidoreductase